MIQTFEYFHVRLDMYQQKLQTQNFNSIMNNLKEKKRAAFSCFFSLYQTTNYRYVSITI